MKAFDADPSLRWLFCMTHPDDEISIVAWMRRLARTGAIVHVSWTHSNPVREAEARRVGALLGIPDRQLHFFGAPDGHVCDHLKQLEPEFRRLMEVAKPDRVVCGAFEQGHIDHDATNFLVHQTFSGPIFEVPFYHTYADKLMVVNRFATSPSGELLRTTKDEALFKRQVAAMYPSQRIKDILFWAERIRRVLGKEPLAATERLRLQTHKEFLVPNLPTRLAKRVVATKKWGHWERAAAMYLNR
jgi:LmbE family N-acetylglucosaminyl deacetylase